jgi:hypothetical protein
MYEKNSADKKKFKQKKKKLKIGVKLQKNLDKNKFGLDKKKSYCLSIKKYCLSIKKVWSGGEKTELCPTPSSTYTTSFHILYTTNNKRGR